MVSVEGSMKKRIKYAAVYLVGFAIFALVMHLALGLDVRDSWSKSIWLGVAYLIANIAGDIERTMRDGDRA